MARFVARRLAGMVLVLFAISVIVFLIFNVIPNSDPALRMAGKNATPQLVANITEEWGFDEPLPEQYLKMMEADLHRGTGLLLQPAERRRGDLEGIPRHSLCIGAAVLWMSSPSSSATSRR